MNVLCPNGHLPIAVTYDANGWRRWCGDCHAPLWWSDDLPGRPCRHHDMPVWVIDGDGIGSLRCEHCGAPVIPEPTRAVGGSDLLFIGFALGIALFAVGVWFWRVWLG